LQNLGPQRAREAGFDGHLATDRPGRASARAVRTTAPQPGERRRHESASRCSETCVPPEMAAALPPAWAPRQRIDSIAQLEILQMMRDATAAPQTGAAVARAGRRWPGRRPSSRT
jgi:hypothetical protein